MRRSRTALLALTALLSLGLTACGDSDDGDGGSTGSADGPSCEYAEGGDAARDVDLPPDTAQHTGDVPVTIATTAGDLSATLDGEAAPCTVGSFVSLAEQGFFDDTPCPRVTTDGGLYVLQCGDPTGTTAGGPGYTIPDEVTGDETYPAGTLAMANSGTPDSGGSQFFIVYEDSALDPAYTVFGTIDQAGIDVVAGIAAGGSDNTNPAGGGAPLTPVDITQVTVEG